MKRKLKLKPFVIPTIYSILAILILTAVYINNKTVKPDSNNSLTYVTPSIFDETYPVINDIDIKLVKPYRDENVKIGIDYYNKDDNEENKNKSIIYYSNTYMPNSGVDYVLDKTFDVLSTLNGEIIEIKEEELLGKTITIRHNNNLISVYQGLSEISVKKGETVAIGQIIGKSGTNNLNKDLGNHLHFEIILNGQTVDPEDYYDKSISEIE